MGIFSYLRVAVGSCCSGAPYSVAEWMNSFSSFLLVSRASGVRRSSCESRHLPLSFVCCSFVCSPGIGLSSIVAPMCLGIFLALFFCSSSEGLNGSCFWCSFGAFFPQGFVCLAHLRLLAQLWPRDSLRVWCVVAPSVTHVGLGGVARYRVAYPAPGRFEFLLPFAWSWSSGVGKYYMYETNYLFHRKCNKLFYNYL